MFFKNEFKSKKRSREELKSEFNKYYQKTEFEKNDIIALIIASFTSFFILALIIFIFIAIISLIIFT